MKAIHYLDETGNVYVKALKKVTTLEELKLLMSEYDELVVDAKLVVDKMSETQFQKFIKSRNKENRGIFSNDKIASIIMMPGKMFKISTIAIQFKVPFGTAYIRLKEDGKI